MTFLQKTKKQVMFTVSDFIELDYHQLLNVNGKGGGSSSSSSSSSNSSAYSNTPYGPTHPSTNPTSSPTQDYNIPMTSEEAREYYNKTDISSPEEAIANGYHKTTELTDKYHEQGTSSTHNPKNNDKYISADGHKEIVFDENGDVVTDPVNKGTYNFYSQNEHPILHYKHDVVPYYNNGTGPNDPTTMEERKHASYTGSVDGLN